MTTGSCSDTRRRYGQDSKCMIDMILNSEPSEPSVISGVSTSAFISAVLSRKRSRRINSLPYCCLVTIACLFLFPIVTESATIPDSPLRPPLPPSPQQGHGHGHGKGYEQREEEQHQHQQQMQQHFEEILARPQPLASAPPASSASSSHSSSSLKKATPFMNTATMNNIRENRVATAASVVDSDNSNNQEAQEEKTNPKTLMMIRVLFLTYYGSLGALMPYLPVYFHSLGHGGQAIGLLGAVKPLTTFIVAPLWGVISDYYQNPSLVLQVTFIASMVLQLLLPIRDEVHFLVGMVFVTALFNAPVKSLIDSMVMDKLSSSDRGQYGKLRLWGQLGFGLGSSIVGCAISSSAAAASSVPTTTTPAPVAAKVMHNAMDIAMEAGASAAVSEEVTTTAIQTMSDLLSNSIEKLMNVKGYQLAFLAYGLISIPAFISMKSFQKFNHGIDKRNTNSNNKSVEKITAKKGDNPKIMEGMKLLLRNGDALLFFFLVLVVGITSGIIENFAYVRIREVGGTGKEMGLCRLTSSLCGAPMFWFSGPLTKMLGADRVLVLTLVSHILRFLNYAFMKHPFHALPAEALRGISFAAFWSTGTIFAHKISPAGMSATMLMFMNAMYGGLGQSTGAIIGGKLQSLFGTTKTFLYSAFADFIFVCAVSIYLSVRTDSSFKNPRPLGEKKED